MNLVRKGIVHEWKTKGHKGEMEPRVIHSSLEDAFEAMSFPGS